eukprot:m.308961 g.308961  ORF g.308961 m.308961 type:complete len:554 (-) comp23029_c0_seq41:19-1680(-)
MAGNGEESVPASPAESPSKKGSWFFRRNSRVGPSDLSFHSPNPVLAGASGSSGSLGRRASLVAGPDSPQHGKPRSLSAEQMLRDAQLLAESSLPVALTRTTQGQTTLPRSASLSGAIPEDTPHSPHSALPKPSLGGPPLYTQLEMTWALPLDAMECRLARADATVVVLEGEVRRVERLRQTPGHAQASLARTLLQDMQATMADLARLRAELEAVAGTERAEQLQDRRATLTNRLQACITLVHDWDLAASGLSAAAGQPWWRRLWLLHGSVLRNLACVLCYLGVGALYYILDQDYTPLQFFQFAVSLLTTVGYGNQPLIRTNGAYIFTMIYALVGLALVWSSLISLLDHLVARQRMKIRENGRDALVRYIKGDLAKGPRESAAGPQSKLATLYLRFELTIACLMFATMMVLGAGVATSTDNLEFIQGLYWAVISASTIGFGDIVLTSDSGMIFTVFWLVPAVLCTANLMLKVTRRIKRSEELEYVLPTKFSAALLREMDLNVDGVISPQDWLAAILVTMGRVSRGEVTMILQNFRALDKDQDGQLTLGDLPSMA